MSVLLATDTLGSGIGLLLRVSRPLLLESWANTKQLGPVVNGVNGFGQVFVLASAYYVGTEIISLAAGETRDPRRSIPRVSPPSKDLVPMITDFKRV
jgi:L-asparagine transporter-like permease